MGRGSRPWRYSRTRPASPLRSAASVSARPAPCALSGLDRALRRRPPALPLPRACSLPPERLDARRGSRRRGLRARRGLRLPSCVGRRARDLGLALPHRHDLRHAWHGDKPPPTASHPRRPARRPAAYHPPSRCLSTPVPLLTTPRRLAPTAPSMPSAHRPQPRAPMPAPSCIAARASSGALALALALALAPALAWASTAAARLLWRPPPAHHPSCHTSCQALPLGLSKLRMDAAHASTSIQASRHATRPCPPTYYAAPLLRLESGGRASPALCSMLPYTIRHRPHMLARSLT